MGISEGSAISWIPTGPVFRRGRFRFRESFPSGFYCVRREFHLFWSIKRLIILEYKENL
ncbi:hypothetical protein LEP1GSC133_3567 [Leptospira borgpetersenii serovar Pomona str. 200901868]|uniref:Uncharacterized protein n=1 Tax=Leptospira borgpetersenii serovar Pomona str. 200901868 TaxID=1192866 RepID=M6WG74_LEPBO|nr:hypothetical protein LEP1GSC133_3567 [Leptospira borgpetersenii serovar Pomona str. 200901868]